MSEKIFFLSYNLIHIRAPTTGDTRGTLWGPRVTRGPDNACLACRPRVSEPKSVPTRDPFFLSVSGMKRVVSSQKQLERCVAPFKKKIKTNATASLGGKKKEILCYFLLITVRE